VVFVRLTKRKVGRMRKAVVLVGAVMAALVFALAGPTSERGLSPHPAQARPPALTVTVACKATPEITSVENNRNRAITIKKVGSIHQPRSNEPFAVNRTLRANRTIRFESGYDADQNVLTRQYIYDNEVGSKEGARVTTASGGRFIDRCGQ
jgi:hypothetical protein